MEELYDFLILEEYINEAFDKSTDDIDELLNNVDGNFSKKFAAKTLDKNTKKIIKNYVDAVLGYAGESNTDIPEHPFIYDVNGDYIKMHPIFFGLALFDAANLPEFRDIIVVKGSPEDAAVYINGSRIINTGRGSENKVKTADQENATCIVWNEYVKRVSDDPDYILKVSDIDTIVDSVSDKFTKSWKISFVKQVENIQKYIKSELDENFLDYKLCRYGKSKWDEDGVGAAYENLIGSYVRKLNGTTIKDKEGNDIPRDKSLYYKKDVVDPSDVILYKINDADAVSELNNCTSLLNQSPKDAREAFVEKLFKTKIVQGLSLKQISKKSGGSAEIFNMGVERIPKGAVRKCELSYKPGSVNIKCEGNYKLDNMTDLDGNEIGGRDLKTIVLTLRSFGNSHKKDLEGGKTVAMDATLIGSGGPSLGKCAANVWRAKSGIKYEDKYDLNKNLEQMKIYLDKLSDKDLKELSEELIRSSLKEGPDCFPFVIIH